MNARPELRRADCRASATSFPASFAQQRLWFLEQLDGSGPVWNVRLPVRLGGTLDVGALEQALAAVVARHESLRTTFGMRGGEIVQFVAERDRRAAGTGGPAGAVGGRAAPVASASWPATPSTCAEGPLLRVFLVELAAD